MGEHLDVVVVGAGFGGLALAHRLLRDGLVARESIAVLERAEGPGGVWRQNTYPGCACDVPSVLYSHSAAPNPAWTRRYSPQREILAYAEALPDRLGIAGVVRPGWEATALRWDDAAVRWEVTTTRGPLTARVVVAAHGAMTEAALPDVPGLADFPGPVLHSAAWDHTTDLAGLRVAVVGTGASAVQIVPAIADRVRSLVVLQRTPPWVMPRGDRAITPLEHRLWAAVPATQRAARLATYVAMESRGASFVGPRAIGRVGRRLALRHLERSVADPALRARLTPTYELGCKRTLVSDDWYPTLQRPDVELLPEALAEVRGSTLVTSGGSERQVDAVVLATGFHVLDARWPDTVVGRHGRSLGETWGDSPRALRGTATPGFPNLFVVMGPNTGLGHTSIIFMIESQAAYVADALRTMRDRGLAAVEARGDATAAYNEALDRRLARTVFSRGGCASYYRDATGRPSAIWPGLAVAFRRATRRFDLAEYGWRAAAGVPVALPDGR